jgi:hypothetical protein
MLLSAFCAFARRTASKYKD